MKAFLFLFSVCLFLACKAQRTHEIQIQYGLSFNRGVTFYDYVEPGGQRRHNFEFDQSFPSEFYSITWLYPLNGYLEVGLAFNHSLNATLKLLEAESLLFDSAQQATKTVSPFFTGSTNLAASVKELESMVKINFGRFTKFKTYLILSVGAQRIKTLNKPNNTVQADDPSLKQHLLDTYLFTDDIVTIGYGLGLSCKIKNGINLKIIEVLGENHQNTSRMLAAKNSIEIRTGISYQFYRKK